MMAGSTGGEKLSTGDYRAIYGVQFEMGRLSGYVALQTPGSSTSDMSYWSQDGNAPAKAANAIPLVKDKKKDVDGAVRSLRAAIDEYARS